MTSELPISFGTAADRAIRQVDDHEAVGEMARHTQELADAMIARGDSCKVGDDEDPDDLDCRLTHFVWAERAKHFLMLYRDVQLQLQIATLMVDDGQSDAAHVHDLYTRSREALSDALHEWETDSETQAEALRRNERRRKQLLDKWNRQHNPWPTYRQQLKDIAEQSRELADEYADLTKQAARFVQLRKLLAKGIDASAEVMQQALQQAQQIVKFIENMERGVAEEPGAVAAKLDDYITGDRGMPRLDRFTNAVTSAIAKFTEGQRVTVASEQGILKYKDINFRRATDQWVSAEVMPQLYELWEISERDKTELGVATINVRNRALLLANELKAGNEVDVSNAQLAQPFAKFLADTEKWQREHNEIRQRLEQLIENNLHLSSVYRAVPGFLPLPLQTGINAFTRRQGRVLTGLRKWLADHVSGFGTFIGEAAREEKLSVAERTVRVIRQRTVDADNAAYTNILMTKGYIGESFLVGREQETEHLRQIIESWMLGYRGAVMLTGDRLAGKTLFGELVTNRFFAGETIRLRPDAPLAVGGRRTNTTGNLAEALAFVEKYTVQTRPLVWIDDLERWWDKDCTLAENVRALSRYIDDYSGRIFFLVATSSAVYRHLDRYLELDRVFQSRIDLNRFSFEDTRRAILLRHGATHKVMVDTAGEVISDAAFDKLVRRIYRATEGNVGDSINRWAYFTKRYDEERVYQPVGKRYQLPAFLSPETATLLTTILLEKRTRDYRLRRLFGPAYQRRYGSILQRLLRIGLVTRNNDGSLEITTSVVNEVGRMLDAEDYLTYGA